MLTLACRYASPEVAPSLNENMMRGSVRSSTFHMKLNASEALYTENAISAVSEEGNYTAPATLDNDGTYGKIQHKTLLFCIIASVSA